MQTLASLPLLFGFLNLGSDELLLILVLTLTLFGSRKLPLLTRGMGQGFRIFSDAYRDLISELLGGGTEAGRSLGGIYGKPAAQAITVENQVAELYDLRNRRPNWLLTFFRQLWSSLKSLATRWRRS